MTSSSSSITFSGLATGLDSASIIKQLVQVESLPIQRLQGKEADIDAKSRKLTTLQSKLDDLRNAALALDSRAEALPTQASSTDASVVSASATGGSSLGSYQVQVDRLASAARVYSNSFAADTPGLFGTGDLKLSIGGHDYTVTVDASDTIDSVSHKIQASGAPVSTGMLYDGTGYRLVVSGRDTGAANDLTIDEGGLTLGLSTPANVVSHAQDAQIRIDGITVTRPTNVVADAIAGVTLELHGLSPSSTTQHVEVTHDPGTLKDKIQKLVDAYNGVNTFVAGEEAWTGTAKDATTLNGDGMLRSVQARLRGALLSPVAGLSGKYTTLASLGLSIQRDGSLSLDAAKLDTAIGSQPDAVAAVLGQQGTGSMTALADAADYFTHATTGVIGTRITSLTKERRGLDDQIASMQARIDKYQSQLQAQFATLEKTVSSLKSQGDQLTAALDALSGNSSKK